MRDFLQTSGKLASGRKSSLTGSWFQETLAVVTHDCCPRGLLLLAYDGRKTARLDQPEQMLPTIRVRHESARRIDQYGLTAVPNVNCSRREDLIVLVNLAGKKL